MAKLRSESGCPWDKEQTERTLVPYLMEEAYEVIEAIDEGDPLKIKEELGDLLFQIVFLAQIAAEKGHFRIEDVIAAIGGKMVSRHPHVFGDAVYETAEEVLKQWGDRKKEEGKTSVLSGVPSSAPALLRAYRLQQRVSRVGFDWNKAAEVFDKFVEEVEEFRNALHSKSREDIFDEMGDIFFTLVNVSRFIKVNPEDALRATINKFTTRFGYIEKKAKELNRSLSDMTIEEMDKLWDEAKCSETK